MNAERLLGRVDGVLRPVMVVATYLRDGRLKVEVKVTEGEYAGRTAAGLDPVEDLQSDQIFTHQCATSSPATPTSVTPASSS